MRIKENQPLAWSVLAVVVVLCLLLSGGGSLKKQALALTDRFFASSESISADLREKADDAYVMAGIARGYEAVDASLTGAVETGVTALRAALDKKDIGGCFAASVELTDAVEDLYTAGSKVEMQGSDGEDFRYKYKNVSSADLRISHDEYNDAAERFARVRNGFPASLISAVWGIAAPETFTGK